MSLGHISKFTIDRETKLGYILLDEADKEYFLHHNECAGKFLNSGDKVDAFIYLDKMMREAATLVLPNITLDNIGYGEVISSKKETGLFVNIGISKDILLSKDDLPKNFNEWPKVGDTVFCAMKIRSNKLILKFASKKDFTEINKNIELNENDKVDAYVYRITEEGINLVTKDFNVIFVYKANLRGSFHIGELVKCKIIHKNDGDYSGTLIEEKRIQIIDDKVIILEYLKTHNGVMLINESSSPELINYNFHMSKSSFKNAIFSLIKEGKIEKFEDKIILID